MKKYQNPQTHLLRVEFVTGLCAASGVDGISINPNGPQIIESE